ncbi:uncharacterized protein LOC112343518 [Selaginella moellendorffii]|uniref:uncharacterized protein LOC112343518 n=1 Tax=Selaginella moellendorffii TaxID=88036 RepID=UPI000D1D0419|nr:uncharacterized protein LOC112343518 [Selaginella moellendorffii]|eukprot:XP_024522896.1 uncharacterized protein LOC112343518 [Selaginella moellendorffii]
MFSNKASASSKCPFLANAVTRAVCATIVFTGIRSNKSLAEAIFPLRMQSVIITFQEISFFSGANSKISRALSRCPLSAYAVTIEFVAAARERGLDVGFYLSPWDLHESCYGDTLLYNEFYLAQLHELLTGYGPISEVWLDGAKSPTAVNMSYDFELWFDTIHPRCQHLFRRWPQHPMVWE